MYDKKKWYTNTPVAQKKLKDLVNNWHGGRGGGGCETTKGAKLNNLIIIFLISKALPSAKVVYNNQ